MSLITSFTPDSTIMQSACGHELSKDTRQGDSRGIALCYHFNSAAHLISSCIAMCVIALGRFGVAGLLGKASTGGVDLPPPRSGKFEMVSYRPDQKVGFCKQPQLNENIHKRLLSFAIILLK